MSKNLPCQANAVFNAGAADLRDEVVLLLRVESSSGRSHLIVARSKDGVRNWQVEDRALLQPYEGPSYEVNGVEDCRITWVEELKAWVLARSDATRDLQMNAEEGGSTQMTGITKPRTSRDARGSERSSNLAALYVLGSFRSQLVDQLLDQ